MKILAHAFAKIARLANINDRTEPILMQIYARLVRHRAEFFADVIVDRHRQSLTTDQRG